MCILFEILVNWDWLFFKFAGHYSKVNIGFKFIYLRDIERFQTVKHSKGIFKVGVNVLLNEAFITVA